jgi:MFS family permease
VKAFGWVSFLTDAGTEMIYPLLPSFLTGTLRAGPAFLGLVEGTAEAVASVLKVVSGGLSDRRRRLPLVAGGYAVSTLARPLVAVASHPWQVFLVRAVDRIGKGVRGAPRDALVAEVTPPGMRGRAYGFHRAMDNAGAMVGPVLATLLLAAGASVRAVFAASLVPGLLSLATLLLAVREEPRSAPGATRAAGGERLDRGLVLYLLALAVFTLGNSADAFLLLRAQDTGVPLAAVPLLWTLHNAVKAAAGTWGGALSDRFGRKRTIVLGWSIYAFTYAGFAMAAGPAHAWTLFALYGLFHALTEGPERALVAALAGERSRGRAFGWYHAVTGAMLLPASLLTGALWQGFGPAVALLTGAGLAAAGALVLTALVPGARGGGMRRRCAS